jgi:two-component system, NarL family, nitrate/nitrite response regulator NarL
MRAIVADDHPLYREAVRLRLERSFPAADVAEASTVAELLRLGDESSARLDLILLDLNMPGMTGAEAIGRVVSAFPQTPVVLMSGLANAADVTAGVRAGARGFLPKTMAPDHFAAALSMIVGGGTYVPADILQIPVLEASVPAPHALDRLTPREQQVLVRLATGAPNKEIGRDLGLAEITIKLHVRQILKKIGARNRSEAASIATRAGLM